MSSEKGVVGSTSDSTLDMRQETQHPLNSNRLAPDADDGGPLPRASASIECDVQSVLRLASIGGACVSVAGGSAKPAKLPKYDDPSVYLPPGLKATELYEQEAKRLFAAATSDSVSELFKGASNLGDSTENGYQVLSNLAETLLSALSLCLLDNEVINNTHCRELTNRNRLEKLFRRAQVNRSNNSTVTAQSADNAGQDPVLHDPDYFLENSFALLDYISATLVKLLCQIATGRYWQENVLAILTLRVTKIKVLLLDMHTSTVLSCQNATAALDQLNSSMRSSTESLDEEECEEILRIVDSQARDGLTTTAEAEVTRYCVEQVRFRSGIDGVLRYLLLALRHHNRSTLDGTSFEICGMVYSTGLENFKVLLFEDRDQEYAASSDRDVLNTAHAAFLILRQAVDRADEQQVPRTGGLPTCLEWRYDCKSQDRPSGVQDFDLGSRPPRQVRLSTMDNIISVMIPLILTSPIAAVDLTKYRNTVSLACGPHDLVRSFQEQHFTAFFCLSTARFKRDSEAWNVMRLSTAVKQRLFSRCKLLEPGVRNQGKSSAKVALEMQDISIAMDDWVIDEQSVTVTCKFKATCILSVAAVITVGGWSFLAIGERIPGVDPSNLMMYLYILAGVFLLFCKSCMVEEWPWSDFLFGRVRCSSVSELRAVTNINDQIIMARLLHDERGGSVLQTRGPYNKAFTQQTPTDGFSIDRPLQMRTLLLSGLIMLKVVTPRGHALVCLDARRGTELAIVKHQGDSSQDHLVCEDMNRQGLGQEKNHSQVPGMLRLSTSKELAWKAVQGVYKDANALFS